MRRAFLKITNALFLFYRPTIVSTINAQNVHLDKTQLFSSVAQLIGDRGIKEPGPSYKREDISL